MKTVHLSIIVFIIGISFVVNNNAHGCNYCPMIPTSTNVSSTFTVSTNLENYASSDKIMITAYVPSPDNNSSLAIKILGPGYNLVDLHTFSPDSNQVGYTWTVLPNGPLFYNSGNYTVLAQYGQNHAVTSFYLRSTPSLITMGYPSSPLQQIKSGIKAQDVKCNQGLQLIIKAEDGSPACVKPDDAYILIYRGWAREFIQTVTWTSQSTCDGTLVPDGDYRKNIFPVLIMSPNSTATVCVTYNFVSDWESYQNKEIYPYGILETCCFVHPGWDSSPVSSNKFEILANPPLFNVTDVYNGSKISVTYKIYAKSDSKGFYDTSVPFDDCLSYPLAVGYGPSEVDATKFHADFAIPCFASIENVDSVKIVTGMTYKEVQFP